MEDIGYRHLPDLGEALHRRSVGTKRVVVTGFDVKLVAQAPKGWDVTFGYNDADGLRYLGTLNTVQPRDAVQRAFAAKGAAISAVLGSVERSDHGPYRLLVGKVVSAKDAAALAGAVRLKGRRLSDEDIRLTAEDPEEAERQMKAEAMARALASGTPDGNWRRFMPDALAMLPTRHKPGMNYGLRIDGREYDITDEMATLVAYVEDERGGDREAVREAGRRLDKVGGWETMQGVFKLVRQACGPNAAVIEAAWDGIGLWRW